MVGLVINARSLVRRITGVESYAREMVSALIGESRLAAPKRNLPGWTGHAWEQLALPRLVRRGELLWSPANSGPLGIRNQALSLHDIFVLEHPEWYQGTFAAWYRWLLPRLARRVRLVITPSEWSRRQILGRFPFLSDKLYVVRAGISHARFCSRPQAEVSAVRQKYSLPEEYLLFVGTLEPRKNIPRLLEAWETVRGEFPRKVLVMAGGTSPVFRKVDIGNPVPSASATRSHPGVRSAQIMVHRAQKAVSFLGYVPDEDLPALYTGAQGVILPSLAEGFGLPALEGMACGAPVIASSAGALPEVVARAGLLVDPLDVRALAGAILCLLADYNLRGELKARGLHRARDFSWEESADRLMQILGGSLQSDAIER